MARYDGHNDALLEWLGPDRRKKPLESIAAQDARRWRESLQDEGRAGKTVLSYLKDAGAIYRAAIREGLVSFNPFSALEAIDTSDSQERKPFTPEEVSKLMDHAKNDEWRGLILVAAYTGLRLGDAARLSWQSVDLEAKKITLIPSKTKKKKREVRIPIHPDLLAFFESVPIHSDKPDAPVFPELSKVKIGSRAGLSQTFNKTMLAAGVDRGKPSRIIEEGEDQGAGRITWERAFHSLRHTFTTWLRTAGVSEEDRMALTGHTTRDSHAIYSHADEKAGQAAIAKLPSLRK
jgi:integrase